MREMSSSSHKLWQRYLILQKDLFHRFAEWKVPEAGPRTVDREMSLSSDECVRFAIPHYLTDFSLHLFFPSFKLESQLLFRSVPLSFPSSLTFPWPDLRFIKRRKDRKRKIRGRMWKNLQFEPGKHMYVQRLQISPLSLSLSLPPLSFETQYHWLILHTFTFPLSLAPSHFLSFSSHHLSLFLTSCIH